MTRTRIGLLLPLVVAGCQSPAPQQPAATDHALVVYEQEVAQGAAGPVVTKVAVDLSKWLDQTEAVVLNISVTKLTIRPDMKERFWSYIESTDAEIDMFPSITESPLAGQGARTIIGSKVIEDADVIESGKDDYRVVSSNMFSGNQVVTQHTAPTLAINFYENDRVLTNDKRERLQRAIKNIENAGSMAIEMKILKDVTATQWTNYFSLVKLIFWDVIVAIKEALDVDDAIDLIQFDLSRHAAYAITRYPSDRLTRTEAKFLKRGATDPVAMVADAASGGYTFPNETHKLEDVEEFHWGYTYHGSYMDIDFSVIATRTHMSVSTQANQVPSGNLRP